MPQSTDLSDSYPAYFSDSYSEARQRLLELSARRGGTHWTYDIDQYSPHGEALSVDVLRFGPPEASQVLVISSGTHGVEGFFGSAAQLALIELKLEELLSVQGVALVIIHAVNPYGFSHLRRVNEDNVDLNRNFLTVGESYKGADPKYALLDGLLNPQSPPPRFELFTLKALLQIIRHGFQALKSSVAQGQYDFERGLFFGGRGPSRSHKIITEHLPHWIGEAERVIHIDLHTGLGPWGTYVMAASQNIPQSELHWLLGHFDQDKVQQLEASGVLYQIRGEFTYYCRSLFSEVDYYPILVEFGTYPILKVLSALRAENRATHWCDTEAPELDQERQQLREAFSPASEEWRSTALSKTLRVIDQAVAALNDDSNGS